MPRNSDVKKVLLNQGFFPSYCDMMGNFQTKCAVNMNTRITSELVRAQAWEGVHLIKILLCLC